MKDPGSASFEGPIKGVMGYALRAVRSGRPERNGRPEPVALADQDRPRPKTPPLSSNGAGSL